MKQMLLFFFFIFFCSSVTKLNGQQRYSGSSALDCNNQQDVKDHSSAFLYSCNGQASACKAFLIFRSQPPHSSVHAISNLTSSDPSEIALINNVSISTNFPTNQEVIVPVTCSCSGQFYQSNTSYVIQSDDETYFLIANDTYQGLSTCSSLVKENDCDAFKLQSGIKLRVPLRCACPTSNQTTKAIKYLLSYSVYWDDYVSQLSERFNISAKILNDANEFTELDPVIYPFTTILIPLQREPSSSQTKLQLQDSSALSPSPNFHGEIKKSLKTLHLLVGFGVGGSFLILLILSISCYYKLLKAKVLKTKGHVVSKDLLFDIAEIGKILKVFNIEELEGATNNFSSECNIAGSVYRGIVDGNVIAIKTAVGNVKEEVSILNKTNHFNLVSLCGLCINQGNCFLIYEYMENGTLRDWLNNTSSSCHGGWSQRVQIALDVASGLHYLHNFVKPSYVHKNVSSKSVLLNGNLRAKIANFGMARPTGKKEEEFPSTIRVAGTVGYMAPEYLKTGLVTPKLDVYAFGVVLLELLTRRSVIIKTERGEQFLSMAVASSDNGNEGLWLMAWIDPLLPISNEMEPILAMLKLSTACLRKDPAKRPTMDEVVSTLLAIQVGSEKWQKSSVGSV